MKTLTSKQAAVELNVDTSRILLLCRRGRLGYTVPKHGANWVITWEEIETYRALGPRKAGRPRKPRKQRLVRISETGNHEYENYLG